MENNTENIRIIEISGIKMEIDLRSAKVIDNFKVGDTVKVLTKSYSGYTSHVGMIVGFDEFKNLPTIVVAYLVVEYSSAVISFAYINSETKDLEICKINDWDIPYSKQQILDKLEVEIVKKERELQEILSKKELFLSMFGKYFDKYVGGTSAKPF
jgi:hypothetical protein